MPDQRGKSENIPPVAWTHYLLAPAGRPGRARRCLSECVIDGIETTIPLFTELLQHPDFANGLYDIHWMENYLASQD